MAEESGVVVRRRGRQEIAQLAALYRKSGMGQSEFCRSHGMALGTLARHLKRQSGEQRLSANTKSDRKSTRLNSSHLGISYAVFCLKKKRNNKQQCAYNVHTLTHDNNELCIDHY